EEDAAAVRNIADDVHHLALARPRAALVDDGEVGVEALGEGAGANDAADVRRDDHQLAALGVVALDVVGQQGGGQEGGGGGVEEALNLAGVEIHGGAPVGAGGGDQIGDQLGGDRGAAAGLAVLTGIAEVGHHRGDPPGRRALERIDADQQLHQVVVGRI